MLSVPADVIKRYEAILELRAIARERHGYYTKWLRYFLDYTAKYPTAGGNSEHVRLFLDKLRNKNQTASQCQQAAHAIALYYEMQHASAHEQADAREDESVPFDEPVVAKQATPSPIPHRPSQYREIGYQETSDSAEWDVVLAAMAAEIKVRHYSRKTRQNLRGQPLT